MYGLLSSRMLALYKLAIIVSVLPTTMVDATILDASNHFKIASYNKKKKKRIIKSANDFHN